jgi:hypothetical protein
MDMVLKRGGWKRVRHAPGIDERFDDTRDSCDDSDPNL